MTQEAKFIGDVKAQWLKDGRRMKLLEDFLFIDSSGKQWAAMKGESVDGASIPKILWTSVGPPFVGKYRRATVLHDVECVHRREPHKVVHQMLYEAMLADKTPKPLAKKIYLAVSMFGPRWDEHGNDLKPDSDDDMDFWQDL